MTDHTSAEREAFIAWVKESSPRDWEIWQAACAWQRATQSAPRGEALGPVAKDFALRDSIREIFLANGFTIKEGQADLKEYVYQAAYALLQCAGLFAAPPASTSAASPATRAETVAHPSIARAIAQEERACRVEDALIDLVNQIRKTNPVDDHGHDSSPTRPGIACGHGNVVCSYPCIGKARGHCK